MTDPTRNPAGGLHDIRPDDVSPVDSHTPAIAFQVGDIVSPDDRGNLGEVVAVTTDNVQVRLVNKQTGNVAIPFFPATALELVRRQPEVREIKLLSYRDLLALPPSEWLIRDVLRRGELAALFGPSGLMKTFLALDMCLSTAIGRVWWEHATSRGPVIYVAGEGLYSIRERTIAWTQQLPDVPDDLLNENFFVLGDAISFLEPDFERLLALIVKISPAPALIVVDTLARCMAGGDENSSADMGLFVRACDRLRKATGASVLLVHHTGKANERIERGSSALRGACDAMMLVTRRSDGAPGIRLECEKQKEAEPFAAMEFELDIVEVGVEEDGRPRMSGRVRLATAGSGLAVLLGNTKEDPLSVIQKVIGESFFEDGASGTQLKDAVKMSKAAFYRHLKKLVDDKLVERFNQRGHFRYRLSSQSAYYRPPTESDPSAGDSSPSPSLASPGDSTETRPAQVPESQSQSHAPPLRGAVGRDSIGNAQSPTPHHDHDQDPRPRNRRSKKSRKRRTPDVDAKEGGDGRG